jgi:hypothetical protein
LLRYDQVIFSEAAIEKLQLSLRGSASKRAPKASTGEDGKKTARLTRRRTRHEKAAEVAG